MQTSLLKTIAPFILILALIFVYGCDQSANDEEEVEPIPPSISVPTAANDGLEAVDLSGITATDFISVGTGTASRGEENISVEVPAGATIEKVYLYWARIDSENSPAAPTIIVNGIETTGNLIGGPVDIPNDTNAGITFRADLTDSEIITSGLNTFNIQDNPSAPAEPLGASVLVFYTSDSGKQSQMLLFDGVDFAFAQSAAPDEDQQEALRECVPRTFRFEATDFERQAQLTLFIGDIEPEDAAERPNSLRIEVGDLPTEQIGPLPNPFQGLQGSEWDNFTRTITIPAGTETITVFPVSGPGDGLPASLVWALAGLSVPLSP